MLAVLTVDTGLDVVDAADGLTSLREAVVIANNLAGADEIVFDFGHDGPATIKLEHGELQLTDTVSIVGGGPELLTIDAQQQSRIFNITAENGDFTIESLTLTNGKTTGEEESGGAIQFWRGALTIQNSVVKDSSATGSGGGIGGGVYSEEGNWLTVNSSTIFGNSAATGGGGIASSGGVTINSSTIAENSVTGRFGSGGGIFAYYASVNSSTISGNSVTRPFGSGGGISVCGEASVNSSTIVGNRASAGGGIATSSIFCPATSFSILNSIVAGNEVDVASEPDLDWLPGTLTIRHSLIGYKRFSQREAPVGSPDADGNIIGGPTGGAVNPHLGPLADNGGPTLTHAPLPGSPAIDAGDPSAVAGRDHVPLFDQRDAPFSRIIGGRIDVGALEHGEGFDRPVGDSNHDGVFNSADLVMVFQAGEYEDDNANNSTFDEGDWNGDGDFDSSDLVVAFQAGNYVSAAMPLSRVTAVLLDVSDKRLAVGEVDDIFESDDVLFCRDVDDCLSAL